MSDEDYGRVPAGWYPDPLGLPQLRWWDNHAWTEHVSDARQPMVAQPAPTTFADDDLPETDPRRSTGSAVDADERATDLPLAHVLKALPAPTSEQMPALVEPAPVVPAPEAVPSVPQPAPAPEPAPQPAPTPAAETVAPAAESAAPTPVFDIPTNESAARDAQWIPMQEPREQQPTHTPGPVPAASAAAHSAPASVPGAPHPGWNPRSGANHYQGQPEGHFSAPQYSAPQYSAPQYSAPRHSAPHVGDHWGASPYYSQHALFQDSPPQHAAAGSYGSADGWGSVPGAPQYVPYAPDSPVAAMHRGRAITGTSAGPVPSLHTAEAWVIALLPMLQLLLSLLVVTAFASGLDLPIIATIWLIPLPIVLVLAMLDHHALKRRGIDRPAGWWWALFTAPVYLTARALRLSRISGAGFGPVAVFLLLAGLQASAVVAVPGLLIAAVPQVFAEEASNTVELNARSIGTNIEVTCAGTPPLFIGQQYRCSARSSDGSTFDVTVSLQRANGWITWQVDDWGVYSMTG